MKASNGQSFNEALINNKLMFPKKSTFFHFYKLKTDKKK